MEATVNSPAIPHRTTNWGMIARVGVVAALVLALVG